MARLTLIAATAFCLLGFSAQAQNTLDIYWIDADGGAATLVVTPERESVLMDAGYKLPDDGHAKRVVAAMKDAGIDSLDYFIASHFHGDHVGGVESLASLVTIGEFVSHGESVEQTTERGRPAWEAYLAGANLAERRSPTPVRPGDILPLAGIDFSIVSSNLEVPFRSLDPQGPNALCENADPGAPDQGENARSVGYLVRLGNFEFLNLGDLTVAGQHAMACPENLIGVVDLMQVPHHGSDLAPQLLSALMPTATVSSTGARKGGSPDGFEVVASIPGIEGIWALHRAMGADDDHNASESMVANPSEDNDQGYWIKAEVQPDGSSFTIINGRNQYSETYTTK